MIQYKQTEKGQEILRVLFNIYYIMKGGLKE